MLRIKVEVDGLHRTEITKGDWGKAYEVSDKIIKMLRGKVFSILIEDADNHLSIATYSSIDNKWRFHQPN